MENARLVKGRKLPTAAEVAEWGWAEAEKGKPFAVYQTRWKVAAFGTRFVPRSMAARMAAKTNEQV
jgi:hypothetical protein